MRSIPATFAWQIWRQYRWPSNGFALYTLLLCVGCAVLGPRVPSGFAVAAVAPLGLVFWTFFPMLFTFSSLTAGADMINTQTSYPPFMLRLPISTRHLVGWPMLFAAAVTLVWWIAVSRCVLHRSMGIDSPLWPGLAMVSLLLWLQAISWSSFPTVWMRGVLALLAMGGITCSAVCGASLHWNTTAMASGYAAACLIAFVAGERGLSIARVGGGETLLTPALRRSATRKSVRAKPLRHSFHSSATAQIWFEWRHICYAGTWLVLITVLSIVVIGLIANPSASDKGHPANLVYVARHLIPAVQLFAPMCLLIPLIFSLGGAPFGRCNTAISRWSMSPFWGVRPLSNAEFAIIKFKVAALHMVICQSIGILSALFVAAYCGLLGQWLSAVHDLAQSIGLLRAIDIVLLAIFATTILAWRQATAGIASGLAGRKWLASATVLAPFFLPLPVWLAYRHAHDVVHWLGIYGVPLLIGVVALKLILSAVAALQSVARRDARWADIRWFGLIWIVAVAGSFAMMQCAFAIPMTGVFKLALACMAFWPLARLMLAPLAVEWNRSR